MKQPKKSKALKDITFGLAGKDPDLLWCNDVSDAQRTAFQKFLEFGEHYELTVTVNPQTGIGTCVFSRQK